MNTKKELREQLAKLEDRIELAHALIHKERDVKKRHELMALRWRLLEQALRAFNDLLEVYDQGEK